MPFTNEFVEGDRSMSNPRITFGQLRRLLIDMGFTETVTPKSHVFFAHERSGAEVALPIYRSNRIVLPHHLSTVRVMLDAKGLMDEDDFDEAVASVASAKQSSS
jgi:predicted RNA binding protein YcfA (HicA-like mRNA interferase family)